MAYLNHAINPSPTICGEVAADIAAPSLLAVKFDAAGKFVLPAAGDFCIGIALANSEPAKAGDLLNVQIKDIGYWLAGAEVKKGTLLQADAQGKAIPAVTGKAALAVALENAAAQQPVKCMICHVTA